MPRSTGWRKCSMPGEDIRFIARRIVICASEDIGMADSQALVVAVAAQQAVEFVGMPEAQLPLAHAAVYLATAPKSNRSCEAISKAMEEVKSGVTLAVPKHLRDAHHKRAAKALGHTGYKYSHRLRRRVRAPGLPARGAALL